PERFSDRSLRRRVRRASAQGRESRGRSGRRVRRTRPRARAGVLRDEPRADRGSLRPHRPLRREAVSTDVAESAPGWVEPFEHALTQGDPLGASDALRKSGVNGWVRKDSYDRAVEIVDRIAPAPVVRLNWAERLLAHPRRVDKELGALIVAPLAKPHWRELLRMAYRLARDDPWASRETGSVLLCRVFIQAFGTVAPVERRWGGGAGSGVYC